MVHLRPTHRRKMVTAYAYHLDAASPWIQSGRPHSILRCFERLGLGVARLFPLQEIGESRRKLAKVWNHIQGRQYLLDRDEPLLRGFAQQLQAALKASPTADFLFSPSTLPLSYLETDLPVTFCADAPFSAMRNYYKSFSRLDLRQIDLAERLEGEVLQRATLAVYPSKWAAESAIRHYGINPQRVAEIPFGANFGDTNRRADVENWIEQRMKRRPIRLLFVGRDWERKRGDLVLATARWLSRRGMEVHVDVVGCRAPLKFAVTAGVTWHGELNPNSATQSRVLSALFRQAHFVFVPSEAEAYGMTFCEANAFGVPIVTSATGGISGIVRDGINGVALPAESEPAAYGAWIEENTADADGYGRLARASYEEFATRLNWDTHCRAFLDRMGTLMATGVTTGVEASVSETVTLASTPQPTAAKQQNPGAKGDSVAGVMGERPLHVLFVTDAYTDPTKVSSWSGTPYFAKRALERHGVRFTVLRLNEREARWVRWGNFLWYRFVHRQRYVRDRHPRLLRAFNRQIRARLREIQPDLIFSMATAVIADLEADCPIAFWVDASFAGMKGFYGSFADLAPVSVRDCDESDREALFRSSLAIYSSEWAAESARRNYPVESHRVHCVNLGANLEATPGPEEIQAIVARRETTTCRLLFVGVDWHRKGADHAIAVAGVLKERGVAVKLTIVGCTPPAGRVVPDFVELIGFVNKQTEEGRSQIARHFQESHFFILPTRAEAYGMVFCEASAYGLPSIAPRVGGIPSIIEDGVNGWLVSPEASPETYAELLLSKWRDRPAYEEMALDSHRSYDERLNWDVAARRVVDLMRQCIRERSLLTGRGAS